VIEANPISPPTRQHTPNACRWRFIDAHLLDPFRPRGLGRGPAARGSGDGQADFSHPISCGSGSMAHRV